MRAGVNRIKFAEEKSPSLMDHTLKIFESIFAMVKEKKERFDNFAFEFEATDELIQACLGDHYTYQDVAKKLYDKGLYSEEQFQKIREGYDRLVDENTESKTKVEAAIENFSSDDLVIQTIVALASSALGVKPGYKAFMSWLYELMDLIDGEPLTKAEWFDRKNQVIDELAYDYARYGLSPHEEIKTLSPAFLARFEASYRAGKAQYGSATKMHTPIIRKWISLRKSALTRGRSFDSQITPNWLSEMLSKTHCPVTGYQFEVDSTDISSDTDDYRWSIERHCNDLGYSVANICLLSNRVNKIRGSLTCYQIFERAAGEIEDTRLTRIEWARLGYLHYETCKRVEPYLRGFPMPHLWDLRAGITTRGTLCHSVLANLVGHPKFSGSVPASLSYFRDQVKQVSWFSFMSKERLDMEVKRLFYVYRQQMKNACAAEVNFALMYDVKDGKYDTSRALLASQLIYLLGTCLIGGTVKDGETYLTKFGKESLEHTLQSGHFKDKGFFKGH